MNVALNNSTHIFLSLLESIGVIKKMKEISLREKEMRFLVLFYFHENTELETITRGVPQGSILGLLLFLLYGNDLKNAINLLDAIMYADDINLFLTHKDISYLSETTNLQLERINQ